jgi:spore maturation protein CgeB
MRSRKQRNQVWLAMRLLRLNTAYQEYLDQFYGRTPVLSSRPYSEQLAALHFDGFGLADFWSHALSNVGYTVMEVMANNVNLQRAWWREHGMAPLKSSLLLDVAVRQISDFRPDVVFVMDYGAFSFQWLTELREKVSSIRLILGWCGAPFRDAEVFSAYDVVLSCVPELVETFRSMGLRSEHLNHGFDPRILERIRAQSSP